MDLKHQIASKEAAVAPSGSTHACAPRFESTGVRGGVSATRPGPLPSFQVQKCPCLCYAPADMRTAAWGFKKTKEQPPPIEKATSIPLRPFCQEGVSPAGGLARVFRKQLRGASRENEAKTRSEYISWPLPRGSAPSRCDRQRVSWQPDTAGQRLCSLPGWFLSPNKVHSRPPAEA